MKRVFFAFLFILLIYPIKAVKKVACVGNSVTYGATLENRETENYPAQLQEMLGSDYQVQNFGKSGATLLNKGHRPYRQQEEYKNALEFCPDIVIIHLGLNDTDPRNWPNYKDEFIPDYLQLIEDFKLRNSKVKIYPCRLTPIFDWHKRFKSGTYTWYHQIQQAIEKVALLANLPLIDLNEDLASRPDIFPDAIHPNKYGATIIARRVYASLTGDFGGLKVANIISDGMVLQRDEKIRISGTANAQEKVSVEFAEIKECTQADFQGKWEVLLPQMSANKQGQQLTIKSGKQVVRINDVLIGDVWLCSGQSNMAFSFKESAEYSVKKDSINPDLRLFCMLPVAETNNKQWDSLTLDNVNKLAYFQHTTWTKATDKSSVANFSAIGITFGSKLADSLNIPIGLIQNAVGGSPQEAWISRPFLENDPALVDILSDFYNNDRIQDWCRLRAKLNTSKSTALQLRHPYQPAYLYESGIKPLNQFPIKGIIWYQGESNTHNPELYELLFESFIDSWRLEWNKDLPVIYAQLSSIDRPSWPYFRNTQRILAEKIPNIYMTVTSDLGDSLNVHPRKKYLIGDRMSKYALAKIYNKNISFSGPVFRTWTIDKQDMVIHFDHAEGLQASDSSEIKGFEITGEDGRFYPAKTTIVNNTVRLHSDKVNKPRSARYSWDPYSRANLVNSAGLPASTFEIKCSYEK